MTNDINNSAFAYSVNLLRLLLKMQLITQEEYERILQISAAHYGTEKIYV
ncbi:SHOCT domain-containing protein [Acutalibacter caecimuris]|nr:SHOCT domain-containing protein [Acutalibacter sp. M00118]